MNRTDLALLKASLTENKKTFCRAMAQNPGMPPSQAYAMAYPNAAESTAKTASSRLMKDPAVIKYIEYLGSGGGSGADLNHQIIQELCRIAFFDLADIVDLQTGDLAADPDLEAGRLVRSFTRYEAADGSVRKQVTVHDKMAALGLLAKMQGLTVPFNEAIGTLRRYGAQVWLDERGRWNLLDLRQAAVSSPPPPGEANADDLRNIVFEDTSFSSPSSTDG